MICIPTITSFVKSRMFNLINIQLLNILGSEITAKKCMHNDLILNWIPVYIKVTKIDSVRFDHTGIKSFFFKFQISVIFYNFIFFPPFLYFLFFFFSLNFLWNFSLNFQIYSWRLLWNRYSALFFNHTFSPTSKSPY